MKKLLFLSMLITGAVSAFEMEAPYCEKVGSLTFCSQSIYERPVAATQCHGYYLYLESSAYYRSFGGGVSIRLDKTWIEEGGTEEAYTGTILPESERIVRSIGHKSFGGISDYSQREVNEICESGREAYLLGVKEYNVSNSINNLFNLLR